MNDYNTLTPEIIYHYQELVNNLFRLNNPIQAICYLFCFISVIVIFVYTIKLSHEADYSGKKIAKPMVAVILSIFFLIGLAYKAEHTEPNYTEETLQQKEEIINLIKTYPNLLMDEIEFNLENNTSKIYLEDTNNRLKHSIESYPTLWDIENNKQLKEFKERKGEFYV